MEKNRVLTQLITHSLAQLIWWSVNRSLRFGIQYALIQYTIWLLDRWGRKQAANQERRMAVSYAISASRNNVLLSWDLNEPRESTKRRSGLSEFRNRTVGTDTGKASGGFRGDRAGSAPPPLVDGPTPSRYTPDKWVRKCWSFYCKTYTSEYSKWLPLVAFSQL